MSVFIGTSPAGFVLLLAHLRAWHSLRFMHGVRTNVNSQRRIALPRILITHTKCECKPAHYLMAIAMGYLLVLVMVLTPSLI